MSAETITEKYHTIYSANQTNISKQLVYLWQMVVCYQNCSDLLLEKIVLLSRKSFEILGWRLRICKIFEITRIVQGQKNFW